ncbi:MAG: cupin domain-containing protein [Fimbriiglobus sp.]
MTVERTAKIVPPGEGPLLYAGGDLYRMLALSADTGGKYGLWEAIVPPGGGPPPHLHRLEEEGFYIIEGEVAVYVDGQRIVAKPGAFVNMPIGHPHWFRNESEQPAKMLVLVAPGGMEGLFQTTGSPATEATAPIPAMSSAEKHRLIETAPKFGIELQINHPS